MGGFGVAFAVAAGLLNAVQAGVNGTLGKQIGQFQAGLVVFTTSFVMFTLLGAVSGRLGWPGTDRIATVPWWAWCGGLLGGLFVLAQLFVAQKLGSAVFMGITVTAAVVMSLALDHFGLVGFEQHSINTGRVIGALLMIGGVGLIALF